MVRISRKKSSIYRCISSPSITDAVGHTSRKAALIPTPNGSQQRYTPTLSTVSLVCNAGTAGGISQGNRILFLVKAIENLLKESRVPASL
jgi:hypothetical protein